ncbi:CDP-alcohol phosphatidyltransferase family protein [Actinocatenispora thailandica]|uniref:CDP-alcohol phosphatidyltransferase family protein n=1 Tax=Actinocatenispora thailandica TaxID=227318 RepID=UPI003B8363E3
MRRGGSLARRVLVGQRSYEPTATIRRPDDAPRDGQHRTIGTIVPPRPEAAALALPPVPVEPGFESTAPRVPRLLPGEHTLRRRVGFLLANGCTVASLLLGVTSIFLAIAGDLRIGALCLVGCVVFDGLDGGVARAFGVSSPFGAQMDSMADMCSFGIAAPVLVFRWLSDDTPLYVLGPACALIAVCAAIRLARFNVSPKDGCYFSGIPTTIVACILALGCLLHPHHGAPIVASIAVLALLMVTTFPYAKLAQLRRLPLWLAIVPVAGALLDLSTTFLALVAIYLLSGPAIWLLRRRRTASPA